MAHFTTHTIESAPEASKPTLNPDGPKNGATRPRPPQEHRTVFSEPDVDVRC